MLLNLSFDVCLNVLAYLSLSDLFHLRLVSRDIHAFIAANEETVFHQAALYHQLVQPRTPLADAAVACTGPAGPWLDGVRDWKELCRRARLVERNWDGAGRVREGGYRAGAGAGALLSFHVDEADRECTRITLDAKGGLVVRALEDERVLWALGAVSAASPPQLVRR